MTKPSQTRKWTTDDIEDIKDALPGFAKFGSLSHGGPNCFSIDMGLGVELGTFKDRARRLTVALNPLVDIEKVVVTSGRTGGKTDHLLIEIEMED